MHANNFAEPLTIAEKCFTDAGAQVVLNDVHDKIGARWEHRAGRIRSSAVSGVKAKSGK